MSKSAVNSNEIGIEVASNRPIYEGGQAMMALVASGTPEAVAPAGGTGVQGRPYRQIVADMPGLGSGLAGVFPYDFDDAIGPTPTYIWSTPGTYNVGLKVLDNGVLNDLNRNGQVDENEKLSDIRWTTITISPNRPPVAEAGGPYMVDEGSAVQLDGRSSSDPDGNPITYHHPTDRGQPYPLAT